MKLSLSVRIAESAGAKDRAMLPLEDLAPLAAAAGFDALSMRASALSVDTPPERVARARDLLDRAGLGVSMVMGNVALAANTDDAPAALRDIAPHLDLAVALGAGLVRVMMHDAGDIPFARRAADEAAERGLALAHQTHWGTLCETVEDALETVRQIDRPNFGLTYEPANLLACGGAFGPDAIARLTPHLANVYFQNIRIDAAGAHVFRTRRRGPIRLRYLALDDKNGFDWRALIGALGEAGHDGWITVHQPLRDGQSVQDAIIEAARVFRPLV
ncbi:MAG: sugar phosphate isomerase/epimerase [Alphaproteobacteria bacterium]